MTTDITAQQKKETVRYGNWPSAISSQLVVSDSISLDEPVLSGGSLYYIERRPQEAGRCVIVKSADDSRIDVLPAPYSARSRVHEYGGGCYCVASDTIFFINDSDQDIYCLQNQQTTRITHHCDKRFADLCFDHIRNRLIAVCETHTDGEVQNSIVAIEIPGGNLISLAQGEDFYASLRLDSTAEKLCWLTWNHPNMPWDGNQLYLATLADDGLIINTATIAGADNISTFQPQWSPDDVLHYIADDSGWWHLYRFENNRAIQLTHGDKEFGLPQWVFAQSTYAFLSSKEIICCYQSLGKTVLASLSLSPAPTLTPITADWQEFSQIKADANTVYFIAASSQRFPQLVSSRICNHRTSHEKIIRRSANLSVSEEHYSIANTLSFTNRHEQTVYANYYPPTNPDYCSNAIELPPLITLCHGGPTGQASLALDPKKQFWTSRGFALLDINYSGSTGYGREYRNRLNKKWGLLDVEDCCDGALYLAAQNLADKNRLIIRGSSAGGYSVLSALTFEDVFSAGASYYGISDLTSLATDTHKFESHYLDTLIGAYPQDEIIYQQRSPINSTEKLNCPVIFFQGVEDRVVPKQQAEKMFEALCKTGTPAAVQYFTGEQHGFRKAATIVQSLENELSFYRLVFKLKNKNEISFSGEINRCNI